MRAHIAIGCAEGRAYDVTVDGTSQHRVSGARTLRLRGTRARRARLFEFLLERELASSILPEFSLDVIGRYFPEYEGELPRRLS